MADAPEVEFRKGTGPNQLPQGAATDLNNAQDKAEAIPPEQPIIDKPVAQHDWAADHGPIAQPSGDTGYLFGPSDRPGEPIASGLGRGSSIPPNSLPFVGALRQLSQDPNAPPQLQALLQLVNFHLNAGS